MQAITEFFDDEFCRPFTAKTAWMLIWEYVFAMMMSLGLNLQMDWLGFVFDDGMMEMCVTMGTQNGDMDFLFYRRFVPMGLKWNSAFFFLPNDHPFGTTLSARHAPNHTPSSG